MLKDSLVVVFFKSLLVENAGRVNDGSVILVVSWFKSLWFVFVQGAAGL